MVVHRAHQKDNALFEQARINIESSLAAAALFDYSRHQMVVLNIQHHIVHLSVLKVDLKKAPSRIRLRCFLLRLRACAHHFVKTQLFLGYFGFAQHKIHHVGFYRHIADTGQA